MRRGRPAAIAAAFAIAAAAAVTAGCGGGSSNAVSLDPVAAAATKTQQAGAARIRFSLAFNSPQLAGGKMLQLRGTGAIDGTSAEATFRLGSIFRQTGLPAGVSPDATMAQLMHASMKEISLQQNGDYVVYLGLGVLASHLPGGKHWIELDLSKLGKAAGIDLGKLLSGSQFQPGDLLGMLKAEGAKISKLGSATVDGAATTHYRVTIDMAKALQAKGLTSPLLAGLAAQMPKVPEERLDRQRRPRAPDPALARDPAERHHGADRHDDGSLRLRRPRHDRGTAEQRRVRRDAARPAAHRQRLRLRRSPLVIRGNS